jgi:hypothetical protein
MKSIITLTAAILMTGCATTSQSVPDRTKVIVGSSCKNFIVQPGPTMEKALQDLKKAAQGRKHSEPVCKHTEHAGIGVNCGTYWAQIVCEATLKD